MTTGEERIIRLLAELREGQKEQLAFSREVSQRSLDAQRQAIELQQRGARLYRIVVTVAALVVAALGVFLFSLTN